MRSHGRQPGLIETVLTSLSGRSLEAPDLDEDALHFWWCGGRPAAFARLRAAHKQASIYEIRAAVERSRPLYDSIVSFAARRNAWPREPDLQSAIEIETPGLSRRAYAYAAKRIVQCFLTFDDWM